MLNSYNRAWQRVTDKECLYYTGNQKFLNENTEKQKQLKRVIIKIKKDTAVMTCRVIKFSSYYSIFGV